ncbi:Elongation factor 1-beta' [Thelohanellus kitauei]|uniref:Elongation factor 1-beta n=1 Tax=Thelohanellus kitauei TaxID=669202 RepID=A0A0C2MAW0_THEKT|nr:Elongation factor 1-beta' [Thelohanellus kitauei]
MTEHLTSDRACHYRVSTMTSHKKATGDVFKSLGHVESGARHLLDAIELTKESIRKSLSEMSHYDGDKLLNVLASIEKRLDKIEARLDHIEGGKRKEKGSGQASPGKQSHLKPQGGSQKSSRETSPQPGKKLKKEREPEKSGVVFEVMPTDVDVDMKELEDQIVAIKIDNLIWGDSKLEEVGYGIKKLTIACVIIGDVSTDAIVEQIEQLDDMVQSVEISGFGLIRE